MIKSTRVQKSTRTMVITGLMFGFTILLCFTPLGMIPTPFLSVTIMHIPTIITALLEGQMAGIMVGAAFGLASLFRALTSPNGVLDPFFINPMVSVLPRILIGLITWQSWHFVSVRLQKKKHGENIAIATGAALGSLTNTLGSLGMLVLLYADPIFEKTGTAATVLLLTTAGTFGLVEMAAAVIISCAVVRTVRHSLKMADPARKGNKL